MTAVADPTATSARNRRDVLGASMLAHAAAVVGMPAPAHSEAGMSPGSGDERWEAALAAYLAAETAMREHLERTYQPALALRDRLAGPPVALSFTMPARVGRPCVIDMTPADLDDWCDSDPWRGHAIPIRDRWREWQRREAEAEQRTGWRAIEAHQAALDDAADEACKALLLTPAPDAAALLVKLPIALESEDVSGLAREALLADARRLVRHPSPT